MSTKPRRVHPPEVRERISRSVKRTLRKKAAENRLGRELLNEAREYGVVFFEPREDGGRS